MDFKFDKSVDYYVGIDLSLAQFQGACSQVSEYIYRLQAKTDWDDGLTINNKFYTSKEEALAMLDNFKDEVTESYADCYGVEYGITIILKKIKLIDVEDIDYDAVETLLSEWVCDEEATEEMWVDKRQHGEVVDESIQIGMWKDYDIN